MYDRWNQSVNVESDEDIMLQDVVEGNAGIIEKSNCLRDIFFSPLTVVGRCGAVIFWL